MKPFFLKRFFSQASPQGAYNSFQKHLRKTLDDTKAAGTYKYERQITSPQSMSIVSEGKKVLNFCANNYLGLANNKDLIESAKATLDSHGFGLSSVRFICGTQDIHKQLEEKIAQFHSMEDTILYVSCFDANAGVFETILTEEDAVISDSLNHASIIDGIRLCKAKRYRYAHLSMEDLENQLKQSQEQRFRLIVTDGVFSMDGDIAPLDKIVNLAKKYNSLLMVDECHASGFLGKTGRGTPELFGVTNEIDIINGTLGKALGGGNGGYTAGKKEIVEMLRQKSRPYLFSNTVSPSIVGASLKVFELLDKYPQFRESVQRNTHLFRSLMKKANFKILGNDECPICPVFTGDAKIAGQLAEILFKEENIYVIAFSYPVVPKGEARIRVQISGAHTEEQIRFAVDAFVKAGKKLNLI